MKILFVANTSFFIHNFFFGLMRHLRDQGHEVIVVSPGDDYSEKLESEGFRFIPLLCLNRKGSNPIEDLKLFKELYGIFRKEKPELAMLFTIKINAYGGIAARLARVRTICTVTGLGWLFTEKSLKTAIGGFGYKVLYRIAFTFSEKVVFQNDDDRDFFLRNGLVRREKTVLTPGVGVDTDHFSPECCGDYSTRNDNPVFLLMARMLWDKGVGEFIEAARTVKEEYPSAEFWLLGPLDYENRSAIPEKVIREWEGKGYIRYKGKAYDVRPFICQSDVMVLPSYREAIGKSILEGMAMEKPVITTDTAGCRDTVESGINGFLVPIKDAPALAKAMIRYIELTSEGKDKMGKRSREKAKGEFDEKIIREIYVNLIAQVRI